MDKIQTKKDEVVKAISKYEELALVQGMFLREAVCKGWTEDFVDEDTSEVVTIERKEVLFDKATALTSDVVSKLLFYFQCGDVKEVVVSNQCRAAYEANYGTTTYIAVAEIGPKRKKYKFLFSASSIPVCVDILKDYIELNFLGGYRIISIKEFQTNLIVDDNLARENAPADEDALNKDKFYQITAIVSIDEYEYSTNAVVKTLDLDKAMILLKRRIEEADQDQEISTRLEEAKLLSVDYIIENDFVAAYLTEK
ncbi:MAG: hypothetical protein RBT74_10680 [Tenuifilaceae bacterium]|jgi:hypothetical protein|nr:hypothetical protein [Tenuifilaceae bacterium]